MMGLLIGSMTAGLAGTGLAAYSAYQQQQSAYEMANYNAQIADENAERVRNDAMARLYQKRQSDAATLAGQRAAVAANGLLGAGSPLEVLSETRKNLELENQNISYNSQTRAQGFWQDADMYRMRASNAQSQLWPAVGGTILGGVSSSLNRAAGLF